MNIEILLKKLEMLEEYDGELEIVFYTDMSCGIRKNNKAKFFKIFEHPNDMELWVNKEYDKKFFKKEKE